MATGALVAGALVAGALVAGALVAGALVAGALVDMEEPSIVDILMEVEVVVLGDLCMFFK
jgi:hypothetical protein